jgi:hypothetical protein
MTGITVVYTNYNNRTNKFYGIFNPKHCILKITIAIIEAIVFIILFTKILVELTRCYSLY